MEKRPAEVFHPAEFIQDELDDRGWSLARLAIEIGGDMEKELLALEIYMDRIDGVLLGMEGAKKLGNAFGTSAELWINLENAYIRWRNPVENQARNRDAAP